MGVPAEIWMTLSMAVPFGLAVLVYVAGRRAGRPVALAATAVMPLIAIALLESVVNGETLRHTVGGWGAPLGIELQVDLIIALFILMTAIVGAVMCCYAIVYWRSSEESPAEPSSTFWSLWLILWGSLNALFISADAFNLYVTLELVTLASVGLVAIKGERGAIKAAFQYLVFALAGSLSYLLGVSLLYAGYGTLDMALLGEALRGGETTGWLAIVAAIAMTLGLLLKAALFPLHFWLPSAHSSAPAPVSAVLSALVVKASFYLVLRFWMDVFPSAFTEIGGYILSVLGAVAVLWGSWQALRTPRLKLLVAYSTVAQLGYLFLIFPLMQNSPTTAVLTGLLCFALAHAFAKAAAFLAAGSVIHSAGHDRIAELKGMSVTLPVAVFAFAIAGISLMGLPPSGGFSAKWMLLNEAIAASQWFIVVVMVIGGLMAAGYIFRVIRVTFHTEELDELATPRSRPLEWTAMALALAALVLGFLMDPLSQWVEQASGAAALTLEGGK